MKTARYFILFFTFLSACLSKHALAEKPIEEMIVDAEFYNRGLLDTATSVSILDGAEIQNRGAVHLENVIHAIPNVNFSSGASRGKFFQIRGIGERSQFVDPINPSVGLIIDGIDLTGIGGAATTLDIKQIEVLRGPQGTLLGANALAGLINFVSEDPTQEAKGKTRFTWGNFNTREFSQIVNGPINDDIALRIALNKNVSDGYMNNTHLDRKDTQNIDESTLRTKLLWNINSQNLVKITGLLVDIDNGYDAFTLDNSFDSLADQPGKDASLTRALSVQHEFKGDDYNWYSSISHASSDLEYSYDEDWTYTNICSINSPCAYWQYSTFDEYLRDNTSTTLDSRVQSNTNEGQLSWTGGIYYRDQTQDLTRNYTNNHPNYDFYGQTDSPETSVFTSEYDTENLAVYGQLDIALTPEFTYVLGLRQEKRNAKYRDSSDNVIEDDESFTGGKMAIEYREGNKLIYGLVSRGYKMGGNNIPGPVDSEGESLYPLVFGTETMLNYELGYKSQYFEGAVDSALTLFYQKRDDMQVKQSVVISRDTGEVNGDCPCDFEDFFDNATAGTNYGAEWQLNAYAENLHAWLNLGLLKTTYDDYESFSHLNADPETGTPVDLDGRAQAHAPEYQFSTGAEYRWNSGLSWWTSVDGKDAFYLSPRHDEQTESIVLLNTRITYEKDNWSTAFWVNNLTDEEVITRGFGAFGNDPRQCDGNTYPETGGPDCYPVQAFYQFGAPRTLGVSATLEF